jgi:hypothetical protein
MISFAIFLSRLKRDGSVEYLMAPEGAADPMDEDQRFDWGEVLTNADEYFIVRVTRLYYSLFSLTDSFVYVQWLRNVGCSRFRTIHMGFYICFWDGDDSEKLAVFDRTKLKAIRAMCWLRYQRASKILWCADSTTTWLWAHAISVLTLSHTVPTLYLYSYCFHTARTICSYSAHILLNTA